MLDSVKWDDKGLAVAIAQNVDTGAILMQGFANREAVATTISSRKATFYSRSRSTLWTKGETSNNFINVHDIFLDCDRDSVCWPSLDWTYLLIYVFLCSDLLLSRNFFSDNIPWEAWWPYLSHGSRDLLLYLSDWFVRWSTGFQPWTIRIRLLCFLLFFITWVKLHYVM